MQGKDPELSSEAMRGKPAPSGSAVYHFRVILTDEGEGALRLAAPAISTLEAAIVRGIRELFPKLQAKAEGTRTDV